MVATSLDLSMVAPISFSAFGPTTSTDHDHHDRAPDDDHDDEHDDHDHHRGADDDHVDEHDHDHHRPPSHTDDDHDHRATTTPSGPLCSLVQGLAPVPLVGLVFSVLEPVFCG